jgi:hypothetical protein
MMYDNIRYDDYVLCDEFANKRFYMEKLGKTQKAISSLFGWQVGDKPKRQVFFEFGRIQ